MDITAEIVKALSPLRDSRLLDVGCGGGGLAKALSARAAAVTGIDPDPLSVGRARRSVPEASFAVGTAEDLPFRAAVFDGVIFLNSLHHVPDPRGGLFEARRVSRRDALVVVVEPLAAGTFFEALRPVEDETEVRAGAQRVLRDVVSDGAFGTRGGMMFERQDRFADVDAFLARVVAVDPARGDIVEARRAQVAEVFERVAERDPTGTYLLRQPVQIDVLTRGY